MKRVPVIKPQSGPPEHWRSLDHLAERPEVRAMIEREFPEGASTIDAPTRRTFMSLMSASFAMMGLTGCARRPEEYIVPYQKMPEGVIPGIPQQFASAVSVHGEALGVLVESHEGRPTKIEGNPDHPSSYGGTLPVVQAMVLDLYDPDRVQVARSGSAEQPVPTEQVLSELEARLDTLARRDGGAGLRVLCEEVASPSLSRMKRALTSRFPRARVVEYSSVSSALTRAATRLTFGEVLKPQYNFDRAWVVLSADSDFLYSEPGAVRSTKMFARIRKVLRPSDRMSRLYVAEPAFSVTGMNADHRLKVPASQIEDLLASVALELAKKGLELGALRGKLRASGDFDPKWVAAVAADLFAHRGASIVAVGSRQTVAAQALGFAINDALNNLGKTVRFTRPSEEHTQDGAGDLRALVDEMNGNKIDTLVILGGNPVYTAPGDIDFKAALTHVAMKVHLANHFDETSAACSWVLPRAHELETWGDLRSPDGTLTLVQPLIAPIFDGKSDIELLAFVARSQDQRGYDVVRGTFREAAAHVPAAIGVRTERPSSVNGVLAAASAAAATAMADAAAAGSASAAGSAAPAPGAPPHDTAAAALPYPEKPWRRALHDGLVRDSADALADPKVNYDALVGALGKRAPAALSAQALELTFSPDNALGDGRYANVSWLQELPHPVTKTVWDNVAWISPKLATELSVSSGDVVRISAGGRSVEIPVWVVPGTADYSVQLHLGWGRQMIGRVAEGRGFNVGPLRTASDPRVTLGAKIDKGGTSANSYQVVVTQEHNMLEARPIIQETTLAEFVKDPKFTEKAVEHPPLLALWDERKYDGHKWGMVIDLNACTGCNTCVIACQSENNVPTVGKEQVSRQREMHWLRIDRYFSGDPDSPKVVNQPMTCQQCENAPCENVCPVNATTHSPEGLNEMTYNRCIGTRYCSNNCPYKVRRFNFLDFHEEVPETVKMVANPNVTVRMRGVMEKCTYCVQRIQSAKIAAKRDARKLRDGDIVTACAQACPADAIVFGDLNDKASRVARLSQVDHGYRVLEELNTKPRTTYIAKIRNPNPEIA